MHLIYCVTLYYIHVCSYSMNVSRFCLDVQAALYAQVSCVPDRCAGTPDNMGKMHPVDN